MSKLAANTAAILRQRFTFGFRLFVAITLLAVGGMASAESLNSVATGTLPALPGNAPPQQLLTVDGRMLALTGDNAWTLAKGGKTWSPLDLGKLTGNAIHGSSSNNSTTWLLVGADARRSDHLEQVSLKGDALVSSRTLPLPTALADAVLTALGDTLYVAGVDDAGKPQLYRKPVDAAQWQPAPLWPSNTAPAAMQAQKGALYVVDAATPGTQQLWRWTTEKGWQAVPGIGGTLVPGSMRSLGQAHLLMQVRDASGVVTARTFHTITSAWASLDDTVANAPVATASWGNGLAWVGADGSFHTFEMQSGKHLLGWLDWTVIIVYLAAMLGMGAWFYFREKRGSTADFFVGGRSIPFWAAGVSLYATNTSSISFIAIPAKAFETNWQYLTNNLIAVVGLMFVAVWIVPLLRRLDLMSVFSYLETRFHPAIRMLASALCIVMQIGARMSVVLFLPALAIATITGINVVWSIMMMGVFTILYTAMGGMKAVIWTDFVQVIVKMGGAIFAILFIVWTLKGGFGEFVATAAMEDKTKLFDFSFDLTKATVWGFIFLVVFDVVLTFPKDQVLMQRTLATKSDKEAGRSIWAFAAIMIPGGFIFYGIGTALWVFYKNNPQRLDPLLPIDATFPLFIAAELPPGVTGLIIAGVFAAAMATLSSIMNSVATLISVDFYERLAKNPNPRRSVLFAEISTVMVGLTAIGLALIMSRYDIHSLFDVSIELAGLLGGGFAGAYTLGMFTRRANSPGVAIGVAASIVLTFVAWWFSLVHPYFYLAISIMLCIVIGYVASLFFPAPTRSLKGLTIYKQDAV
ncbi:sodium:solute symporter [Stenotrophomonas humi]|uniref:Sodium:solute symporter n=1 Tax=Stenotrophomonas humi TaxID=405444 RepID=A0A0R0CB88_9GAMM|nr:sodium:solute symporter [Stenotrophomonas humi]KRG63188.1 sodium:solute symporter [Stenotrophomonas humi]